MSFLVLKITNFNSHFPFMLNGTRVFFKKKWRYQNIMTLGLQAAGLPTLRLLGVVPTVSRPSHAMRRQWWSQSLVHGQLAATCTGGSPPLAEPPAGLENLSIMEEMIDGQSHPVHRYHSPQDQEVLLLPRKLFVDNHWWSTVGNLE